MNLIDIPPIDILGFVRALITLTIIALFIFVATGINRIKNAQNINYYRIKKQRIKAGWRQIMVGFVIGLVTLLLISFGEPIAFSIYEVTGTPSPTPTVTMTPTITPTPTITLTPTITNTPDTTFTPTPNVIPSYILETFSAIVTPPADAAFSELIFSKGFDKDYLPVEQAITFNNPAGHIHALFTYNNMLPGVQWTALWYFNNEVVRFETLAWDGMAGGFGYTDWNPSPDKWQPGTYTVYIFIGETAKVSGSFTIEGTAPTLTPTQPVTPTPPN